MDKTYIYLLLNKAALVEVIRMSRENKKVILRKTSDTFIITSQQSPIKSRGWFQSEIFIPQVLFRI